MIESIHHKGLRRFFETGNPSKLHADHIGKLRRILAYLDDAEEIKDMNLPGFDLHQLTGDLADFYAVKVNKNWRVIFRFENGKAYDVDYLDYH